MVDSVIREFPTRDALTIDFDDESDDGKMRAAGGCLITLILTVIALSCWSIYLNIDPEHIIRRAYENNGIHVDKFTYLGDTRYKGFAVEKYRVIIYATASSGVSQPAETVYIDKKSHCIVR